MSSNLLELKRARRRIERTMESARRSSGSPKEKAVHRTVLLKLSRECSGLIACAKIAGLDGMTPTLVSLGGDIAEELSRVEESLSGDSTVVASLNPIRQTADAVAFELRKRLPGKVKVSWRPSVVSSSGAVGIGYVFGCVSHLNPSKTGEFSVWIDPVAGALHTNYSRYPDLSSANTRVVSSFKAADILQVLRDESLLPKKAKR